MPGEIISIVGLLIVVFIQLYLIFRLIKSHGEREKDLLNRVMSRNYETYVQAEVLQQEKQPLTSEEIYEQQMERGIPV